MTERRLGMKYDPVANAAYIYVSDPIAPGEVAESRVLDHFIDGAAVVVDFDKDNRLLGIELLGVASLLKVVSQAQE